MPAAPRAEPEKSDGNPVSGTAERRGPLTDQELAKRLTVENPKLVSELYRIAEQQIEIEAKRQTRLDYKATSLLTAAGLSLTVAITFGGLLITQSRAFDEWREWIIGLFVATVIAGITAAIYALRAQFAKQFLAADENAIFDTDILKTADTPATPEAGLMEYQKSLIIHLWAIRGRAFQNHVERVALVKMGQRFFIGFLFGVMVVSAVVAAAALCAQ